jgi:hypothetical protein
VDHLKAAGPNFLERMRRAGFIKPTVARFDKMPVTQAFLLDVLSNVLQPPLLAKLGALDKRLREVEARPAGGSAGVQWAGTYDPAKSYTAGSLITRQGGLWLALRDTAAETPGSSTAWRLVVKRGAYDGTPDR